MTYTPAFIPSLKWHARFLGVLLAVCLAGYFVFLYVTAKLPAPYQTKQPSAQATPWIKNPA